MIVAVGSGKGGTGKTFVSTNIFQALLLEGRQVMLVDCDAEEPNVGEFISGSELGVKPVVQRVPVIDTARCTFCGTCADYCAYNAIVVLPSANYIKVLPDLCHDCGACVFACEQGAVSESQLEIGQIRTISVEGGNIAANEGGRLVDKGRSSMNEAALFVEAKTHVGVPSSVPVIRKAIKEAIAASKEGGAILLDVPPGISCPFIATIQQADHVVLVTEPTPFGLNDLKLSVETVRQLGKPFGVVVNRAGLGDRALYDWLAEESIPLLMEIPFNARIARVYSEGFLWANEEDDFRKQCINLFETICHEAVGK